MQSVNLVKHAKLILIIALIIGLVGAVSFLIYSISFLWQAMAATVIIIFLSIISILFIFLSIYLWFKNLMLNRDLDKNQKEMERISNNLKNCNRKLREKKSQDKKS